MNIYVQSITSLAMIVVAANILWAVVIKFCGNKQWFKWVSVFLVMVSLYGILHYTLLGRHPSETHVFKFAASTNSGEFFREMFMNALLYFPLGLSLSALLGLKSVLIGIAVSVAIESWQFFAGTGLSQGTDVIMNSLGSAVGMIPWIVTKFFFSK